jgi:pimeloyl-ACP methyl ester carboxylesterase
MSGINWSAPNIVSANGARLAVWEQGAGFPVVLCHGFPELAYSWRHQMPALAGAGYRAIAPDQRGYGRSIRPGEIAAYDIQHLTGDLVGLLDALGLERAVFAGHDWGGIVVWQLALLRPERVAGVIALNTPFQPRGERDLISTLRHVFGEQHYMVAFQEPGRAEALFERDFARVLERMYRKPKTGGAINIPPAERGRLMTLDALAGDGPAGGIPFLAPAEMAYYVDAFRRTGFGGGINWYRNLRRNWELTAAVPQRVEAPALMVSAANDIFLPPSLTEGMQRWVPRLERHVVADCGHWTQQERPDEVNRLMIGWLSRWFRPAQGLRLAGSAGNRF